MLKQARQSAKTAVSSTMKSLSNSSDSYASLFIMSTEWSTLTVTRLQLAVARRCFYCLQCFDVDGWRLMVDGDVCIKTGKQTQTPHWWSRKSCTFHNGKLLSTVCMTAFTTRFAIIYCRETATAAAEGWSVDQLRLVTFKIFKSY